MAVVVVGSMEGQCVVERNMVFWLEAFEFTDATYVVDTVPIGRVGCKRGFCQKVSEITIENVFGTEV